jgi:MFS family permease
VLAVSAVLTGLAPNFALAVLFRAVGGAGSAVMFAAMYSYLLKAVPRDRMARTLGIFYGAFNIGLIAGGPAGGLIAHAWGLAAPLFVYAGLQVVCGILFLRFVRPVRSDAPATPESEAAARFPSLTRIRRMLRDRGFITTLILNLAYAWMVAGIYDTLIPLFGRDGLGMSTVAIGAAFAVALLTELLVLYPAGSLADRFGRKPVVVPSLAGLAVVTVLLGWAGTPGIYFVLLAVLGVASGVAGVIPTAMLSDVAPAGAKGTAVGLYRFCGDIGFTFGPLIAGATVSLLTFKAAFAVAAVPTVLALAFALATPETLSRREPEPAIPPPSPQA